jgi:hypothetical protein
MDPDIAPLARRLAEENNVDWRRLAGSGTDGRIVERDVLDFLARVMAGEEDTDPTPEPLPEGVEAWPDQAREAGDASAPVQEGGAPPAADAVSAGAPDDEELLLAGDDLEEDLPAGPADAPVDTADDELLLADDAAAAPASGDDVPDLFAGPEAGSGASGASASGSPDLFLDEEDAASGAATAEDEDAFDFGGLPGAGARTGPEAGEPPATEEPAAPSDASGAEAASEADALGPAETDLPEPPTGAVAPDEEPWASDAAGAAGTAGTGAAEPPVPDALAPEQAAARDATGPLPLARTRTVLRRHVDVGPAFDVRRSVALEAGRDDLPLAALLLVAARRAAGRLDVTRPAVAVAGPGGRIGLVAPDADGLADLAGAIDAAAEGPSDDAEADLWVVDLSDAGVDEAVLDGDAPQLVLGRVLTDREDGSRRATLSLAADVPLERGTAFLTRVADLLEQPLRLLA